MSGADVRCGCPTQIPARTLPPVCMSAVYRPTDGRYYSAVVGAFLGEMGLCGYTVTVRIYV